MAAGLSVMISEGQPHPFWDKFLEAQESSELDHMDAVLKELGAWTDWHSWSEPVWFENQEAMMAFVLAWS